ncbi:MAG: hypothetical protein K0R76_1253 [Alphaproteobacteria bacterium]|jgi:hypothetical protein|nr:hypothetical protein [Alphaproteobacteria bacterium]
MLTLVFADRTTASEEEPAGGFDFQMPEEDTSEKTPMKPKKKATKRPEKSKSKAVKKAQKTKKAAKAKATQVSNSPASQNVQDQIRLLNEKIDRLEAGRTLAITPASALPDESGKGQSGFIPVPGTNTVIKIGGYVKVDGIYDANQFTGDSSNLPNLRLKGLDADALRSNVFTAHAKQTRLSLGSETMTAHGQVLAYFEGDFFGNSSEGTTGGFTRADTSSVNSYNFRIRHAYGSYCFSKKSRVDVGQMWTLFYDPRSNGTTVEFNGPETTAQIRRPQIRYTHSLIEKEKHVLKIAASAESAATENLDISPAFVGTSANSLAAGSPSASYNASQYRRSQSSFLGGMSGDGNQALPDLVGQVLYKKKNAYHFTLGGMVRELKVKKVTTTGPHDPVFSGKKYGYGVALGGRAYVHKKSSVFAQMNFGKGIGAYIFALDGYGAAIDASRGLMQTQFGYGFLVGGEHYWSDTWRTNVIYSQAGVNVASFIPTGRRAVTGLVNGNLTTLATTGYSISNRMRQFYLNLLWSPVEKFDVGIEYAYFQRGTINNYIGYGNRFQFGAYYKF